MHHCLNPLNFKDFKIYILINKLFHVLFIIIIDDLIFTFLYIHYLFDQFLIYLFEFIIQYYLHHYDHYYL